MVSKSIGAIRMITGLLVIYHGLEVFSAEKMNNYFSWDSVKRLPLSTLMVYAGKYGELISGILLTSGLFTRWAALLLAVIMFFITFFIGQGRFWYEDQHPFLFALIGLLFASYGPGAWALDKKISKE